MTREIAVYIDENGSTASLSEPGRLVVYRRKMGKWSVVREKGIPQGGSGGLKELRQKMGQVLAFLGDCGVFVGRSVTGVPYYELEKAGCSVWEFEGRPEEFLDYVLQQEEAAQQAKGSVSSAEVPVPVENSPGCYHISLKKIQAGSSGVTSKQVLLPFLRQGTFYSLQVVCSHIPPWLEAEMSDGKLVGEVRRDNESTLTVTIAKKTPN